VNSVASQAILIIKLNEFVMAFNTNRSPLRLDSKPIDQT
jgi:hypothetical protein